MGSTGRNEVNEMDSKLDINFYHSILFIPYVSKENINE